MGWWSGPGLVDQEVLGGTLWVGFGAGLVVLDFGGSLSRRWPGGLNNLVER